MKHVSEQKVNKFINLVNKEIKKNGFSDLVLKCENVCYQTQNVAFMIEYCAKVKEIRMLNFEDFIIANGTPEQIFAFGTRVKGSNKEKITSAIAKSQNPKLCYEAAYEFNTNVIECGKVVLDKGDYFTNYAFARDIKGADVSAHQNVVVESNDVDLIYAFAMDVEGADVFALYHKLVELGANNNICYNVYSKMTDIQKLNIQVEDMKKEVAENKQLSKNRIKSVVYYAQQVYNKNGRNEDIIACQEECFKTNDVELLIEVAKIKGFNRGKISEIIATNGNSMQNYVFVSIMNKMYKDAKTLPLVTNKNIKKIVESKDPYINLLAAKDLKLEDISKCEEVILNAKCVELSKQFAREVKGANVLAHQEIIMKEGTVEDILEISKVSGANKELAYKALKEKGASSKTLNKFEKQLSTEQKLSSMLDDLSK